MRKGSAPQPYGGAPPEGVREVEFKSGDLLLKAWLLIPRSEKTKHPALVYFHGGFALAPADIADANPFLQAGFVVMAPMLRGENGNPGNFELFLGEVDDGAAAVRWLAEQPFVSSDRIYTFGHSAGGAISALLSLTDDVPIVHGGSSGGIYMADIFQAWDFVPFDTKTTREIEMRLLLGNTADMKRQHFAYIGTEDAAAFAKATLEKERGDASPPLRIIEVAGDHFSSLADATKLYLERIQTPAN